MRVTHLAPMFIEQRPEVLEEGVLYISVSFRTTVHLCCCGCGNEVWLPIRPTRWRFTYDGEAVSLSPSVGNWSFACKSHYWIRNGRIDWAAAWSNEQIEAGRRRTRARDAELAAAGKGKARWWQRFRHPRRQR